ncbi:MAG TPA: hypothetical protein PKA37_01905, partial [Planctomycetota bacterium]|nr:hypothetical protein [Planctomycetota bacterium]
WGPLGLERRLGALLEGVPNSSRRRAHAWIDFAVRNGFLLPPRGEVSLFPISCPLWDDLCAAGVVVEIPRRVGAGRVRHAWRSLGELRIEEAADEIARFLARA